MLCIRREDIRYILGLGADIARYVVKDSLYDKISQLFSYLEEFTCL
jgi:hypothetical protein